MSSPHELHTYDYVNHPYETVRGLLLASPSTVFRHATTAMALRNEATGAELHAKVGPLDISAEVEIKILVIDEAARSPNDHPATKLEIEWKTAPRPELFPTMQATLSVYALTPTETQLDFSGAYDPPMGLLGEAVDAIVMHKIATGSVTGFVREVASFLRGQLAAGHIA
jgi:hypothetical protein